MKAHFARTALIIIALGSIALTCLPGKVVPPYTTSIPVLYLPITCSEYYTGYKSDKLGAVGMASNPAHDFPALGGKVLHIATLPQCDERGARYGTCIPYLDHQPEVDKALDDTYDLTPYDVVLVYNERDVVCG